MKKLRYLIIDDDIVFSLWLRKTMETEFPDFEFINSRDNTLEGLFDIQREQPELLFLDQYIDGLDGFDVIDLMKHSPNIIMVSSDAIEDAKLQQYANVIGFLEKPINMEKLKKLVQRVL